MLAGLAVVAVWVYLRYPRLRPATMMRAAVHVAISFVGLMLVPVALDVLLARLPARTAVAVFVIAVLVPALSYLLLSWVWLLATVARALGGGSPRGGHPVTSRA